MANIDILILRFFKNRQVIIVFISQEIAIRLLQHYLVLLLFLIIPFT